MFLVKVGTLKNVVDLLIKYVSNNEKITNKYLFRVLQNLALLAGNQIQNAELSEFAYVTISLFTASQISYNSPPKC